MVHFYPSGTMTGEQYKLYLSQSENQKGEKNDVELPEINGTVHISKTTGGSAEAVIAAVEVFKKIGDAKGKTKILRQRPTMRGATSSSTSASDSTGGRDIGSDVLLEPLAGSPGKEHHTGISPSNKRRKVESGSELETAFANEWYRRMRDASPGGGSAPVEEDISPITQRK
jgi:hypothetical protein